ncbi:ECs1072 family phage-associated protein [Providencia sp.]|uniref:ECs1072 family phage-associated protein n=1 Tax=Providencia sp. TaxID=589 RepID=UPI003F965F5D
MSIYSTLWATLNESLCEAHNLESCYFKDNDPRAHSVRKKAYILFLLEVVMYEYRNNEIDIWFKQSFDNTLTSFAYNKTGILPDLFYNLSDTAKIIVLQKHLLKYPLPENAQTFLKNLPTPLASDNLEVDLSVGWTLGNGWQYLKQQ